MSKEEKNELQEAAAGGENNRNNSENQEKPDTGDTKGKPETADTETKAPDKGEGVTPEQDHNTPETGDAKKDPGEKTETAAEGEAKEPEKATEAEAEKTAKATSEKGENTSDKETEASETTASEEADEDAEEDIDASNAEDAEDSDNERRHHIPFLDYHSLSMENLVGELQRLLRTEKVQAIKRHVDSIKREFDQKFRDFLEEKKDEFISRGGEASDFRYNSVTKRQFNELYSEYREKRNQYYKNLERNLHENLERRQEIIEELKGLVNMEEDMTTTYKNFKELQERWKQAGPVPRAHYNDVWRTYQHHVEIFYDFLSLNRELRDLDFKYNLEEKEKLCQRAEALLEEEDVNKAFRELQVLHKIWKEEIGPVSKEQREPIWERFSEATKKMHQRRQEYFQKQDERYQVNLEAKLKIIAQIEALGENVANRHRAIQKQIREVESLREQFFQAGKVPRKDNESTWAAFKKAVRTFNRNKNAFYKNLKKEQQENLDKKKALLGRALELKDSEEWDTATPEMKRIQREWKEVGHVPRKYSDKIWKQFKAACNHYFDRLHARKNSAYAEEKKNLDLKSGVLEELRAFQLGGDRDADLKKIQEFIARWKAVGHVPRNKKHITSKFYKIVDALFRKLDIGKQEAEILKYGDKIARLEDSDDERAVEQERQFVRRKMDEIKGEIRQLENNLNFFSDPSEDNPLVREVVENLKGKKEALESWKAKLKELNILRNHLTHESGEAEKESGTDSGESVAEE
ncbi:MAG: DUF349 domain-containing protein [Robiginitalea sp.]